MNKVRTRSLHVFHLQRGSLQRYNFFMFRLSNELDMTMRGRIEPSINNQHNPAVQDHVADKCRRATSYSFDDGVTVPFCSKEELLHDV